MSRPDSNSPSPALPRRSVLKGLAAAPAALAATSGEAFSSTPPVLKNDARFVKADGLITSINAAYSAFIEAGDNYEFGDDAGETIYEAAAERYEQARDVLESYAAELAEKTPKDIGDALVLAKLADFHLLDERVNLYNLKDIAPNALRAILEAHGLAATEETVKSIECKMLAEKAARDATSNLPTNFKPDSVTAGEDIAELRRLSERNVHTLLHSAKLGGVWGTSPECKAANDESDRAIKELFDFGEVVNRKIGNSYTQRDDFVVLGNLILAIDDIYLEELEDEIEFFGSEATVDGHRNRALSKMIELARTAGDSLVREAARWNAENGGANV
ncbi:MAG: hypothetical protein QM780_06795 [Hyphomicrobium sp.]|uniref:hypothetical protein n=1 Tax=Hyphomicrobium sp. TaxID=82 RepID=UPI0039E626C8